MEQNVILVVASDPELYNVRIKIYRDMNQTVRAWEAIRSRLRQKAVLFVDVFMEHTVYACFFFLTYKIFL